MAVSVIVQRVGSGDLRQKGVIRSALIKTEPQAVNVGIQELRDWYWRYRRRSIVTPYRGIQDGDAIEFSCSSPEISGIHRVSDVSISISRDEGVVVTLTILGEYDDPAA